MWRLFGSLVIILTIGVSLGQDIVFRDEDNVADRIGGNGPAATDRLPIYIPGQCPLNMLSYPGDGDKSAWVCDCMSGYVYFPLNDTCHAPYRQGLCPPEHYVVLPLDEVIPKCERNPCLTDGLVLFNNTCVPLKHVGGPCPSKTTLDVNKTTFQLECVPDNIGEFNIIDAPENRCPNGSKRNGLNQCRKMI